MHPTVKYVGLLTAAALALSACGSPATPTTDPQTVYTQAAGTVQAVQTQNAALTPSPTPTTEPTNTPVPPTEAPTAVVTPSAVPPTAAPVVPTKAVSPDRAEFVTQSPADGSKVDPGAAFTVTWTVKNTGTTTWSTAYLVRFYAGTQFGAPASSNFPKEVKPGDTVELSLNLTAPSTAGEYQGTWVLTNSDGVNFFNMFILVKVGDVPAATATTAATAAPAQPTAAPTEAPTVAPTTAPTP